MLRCSYTVVHVELKNQGEDAFKHDIYGDVIIIERKISSGSSNATVLKDHQGLYFLLILCFFWVLCIICVQFRKPHSTLKVTLVFCILIREGVLG